MSRVFRELRLLDSTKHLFGALVFAVAWFFVLRIFTEITLKELPIIIGAVYVFWQIAVNSVATLIFFILKTTAVLLNEIVSEIQSEGQTISVEPPSPTRVMVGAIFLGLSIFVVGQGAAVVFTNAVLPYFGRPPLPTDLNTLGSLMAVVGAVASLLPFVTLWVLTKRLHGRATRRNNTPARRSVTKYSRPESALTYTQSSQSSMYMLQRKWKYPIAVVGTLNR